MSRLSQYHPLYSSEQRQHISYEVTSFYDQTTSLYYCTNLTGERLGLDFFTPDKNIEKQQIVLFRQLK